MWHQILIPIPIVFIPIMIMTTTCHTPKNNTDVIVTYSNHADADYREEKVIETTTTSKPTTEVSTEKEDLISSDEGIVFVPNDMEPVQNEEHIQPNPISLQDILTRESIGDIMNAKDINSETETPSEDIIFVTGINSEFLEKNVDKKPQRRLYEEMGEIDDVSETTIEPKLICKNLNCNSTIESICGARKERTKLKYRLFLNDCFFRKVNCHFRNKDNRYKKVELDKCKNIAVHVSERPVDIQYVKNSRRHLPPPLVQIDYKKKASRRSMALNMNGRMCDHVCPPSCAENYDPECAVSETGHKKVFLNHCQMDLNSCKLGIAWRRRPLADCVGNKKADVQHNRGFINWMQSVGIIDNKGRLTLS